MEITSLTTLRNVRDLGRCLVQGIEREYQELDTVWFMAGSLFQNYPYDIPTEAFSMELFKQARHSYHSWLLSLADGMNRSTTACTRLR